MHYRIIKLSVPQSVKRSHRSHQHLEPLVFYQGFERYPQEGGPSSPHLVHCICHELVCCKLLVEPFVPEFQLQVVLLLFFAVFDLPWGKTHLVHKLFNRLLSPLPEFAYLLKYQQLAFSSLLLSCSRQ